MDVVEQVARAICLAHAIESGFSRAFAEASVDKEWTDWVAVARAAIAAMREPTRAMLEKGPLEPYMDEFVWARMIDAALTSSEPQAPSSE